jgi:hypothetical protein
MFCFIVLRENGEGWGYLRFLGVSGAHLRPLERKTWPTQSDGFLDSCSMNLLCAGRWIYSAKVQKKK